MILKEEAVLNGRYRIESVIGQGGMSYVYRARDTKMDRTVAVKVLKEEYCDDADFIRKFQNEAQAAAKLNHPNIVAPYDVVDDEGKKLHYIVMELVEGITLKNYIQRKGKLENRESIGIALQVIDGMEHAHRMGIVHRDIKPQNMIVGENGVVKVADFGIARAATQQTVNATVMGSVHYISPEQARSGVSDERSDIYSFGCTMYEMLTGKVPYDGESSVSVVFSHLENPVPRVSESVPEVYPALDRVIFRCMQKKPGFRYAHIGELREDLRKALENPNAPLQETGEPGGRLGETRVLTAEEMEEIRSRSAGEPEAMEKLLPEKRGRKNSRRELAEGMTLLYRGIAVACLLMIAVLLGFLGTRLYRFLRAGSSLGATAAETSEQRSTEPSTQVSITISALENRLPGILGKTLPEAESYLSGYQISLYAAEQEYSDRYGEGQIISYPDGIYDMGDSIGVTVSKGRETLVFWDPAEPENLEELNATLFSELEKELRGRKIPYRSRTEFSETVPQGYVIKTSKPDSSGAEELEITVSEGSAENRARVPAVTGLMEEEAVLLLQEAGLLPGNISYLPDQSREKGRVISQGSPADSVMERNSYVSLTVSAGPDGESSVKPSGGDSSGEYWYSSINERVNVGVGGPGAEGTMLVQIRLRQDIDGESRYTVLQSARSYTLGTELQVVFSRLRGEPGVAAGVVEIVNAETDEVFAEYECSFSP